MTRKEAEKLTAKILEIVAWEHPVNRSTLIRWTLEEYEPNKTSADDYLIQCGYDKGYDDGFEAGKASMEQEAGDPLCCDY